MGLLAPYAQKNQIKWALKNAGNPIQASGQYSVSTYKFNLNTKNIFSIIGTMKIWLQLGLISMNDTSATIHNEHKAVYMTNRNTSIRDNTKKTKPKQLCIRVVKL